MLTAAICSQYRIRFVGERDDVPHFLPNIQTNPERMLVFRSRQALRKRRKPSADRQRRAKMRTITKREGRKYGIHS